eukprot:2821143-Prymnesium_polylepis.1
MIEPSAASTAAVRRARSLRATQRAAIGAVSKWPRGTSASPYRAVARKRHSRTSSRASSSSSSSSASSASIAPSASFDASASSRFRFLGRVGRSSARCRARRSSLTASLAASLCTRRSSSICLLRCRAASFARCASSPASSALRAISSPPGASRSRSLYSEVITYPLASVTLRRSTSPDPLYLTMTFHPLASEANSNADGRP